MGGWSRGDIGRCVVVLWVRAELTRGYCLGVWGGRVGEGIQDGALQKGWDICRERWGGGERGVEWIVELPRGYIMECWEWGGDLTN